MEQIYFWAAWRARQFLVRQEGQGMVEYAMILILISIVVIIVLLTMGGQVKNMLSNVACALGAGSCKPAD
ncbi:MAG: hypothetical protein NVS9B1_24210 [Candidatus Dormibacteraceae bacterium]